MPPLLVIDVKSLIFDKECGAQKLNIAVQGTWLLKIKDTPSWVRADQYTGTGELTEVFISVDKNIDEKEWQTFLQIYRMKNNNCNITDELIEVKVIQSAGKINK